MSMLPEGIVIVCDGGCRNNQTPDKRVAYGSLAVFVNNQRKQLHYTGPDGRKVEAWQARVNWQDATNNQAEFKTALMALGYIRELFARSQPAQVTICSDSELVVNTALGVNKKFKVEHIRELAIELKANLEALPSVKFMWLDNSVVKEILGH